MPTHVISADGITADPNTGDVDVVIKKRKLILTDAQIKALPTTPIDILQAPGAGKEIYPLFAIANFKCAVPYTNVVDSLGILGFFLQTFNIIPYGNTETFLTSGATGRIFLTKKAVGWVGSEKEVLDGNADVGNDKALNVLGENTGLSLYIDNYTADYEDDMGNFTGGDAANTIEITVVYSIVDL
jgi:hypothetical protein